MNNAELNLNIKDLGKELFLFTSRPNSIQRACFYCLHFQKNAYQPIKKVVSLPISKTDDEWFFSKDDFEKLSMKQAAEFTGDNFLEEYKRRGSIYFNSWYEVCKKVNEVFSINESKDQKAQALKEYYLYPGLDESYAYFSLSVWSFDQKVVPVYTEKLKNYFGERFSEIWEIITSQTKLTEDQEMRIELAGIKKSFGEEIPVHQILSFQNKYRYLGIYAPEDFGFTTESIKEMYSEMNADETVKIIEHINKNKESFNKLRGKIKEDEILQIIDQINYNVFFRTSRSERLSYGFALISIMYETLIKELGYSRLEIGNLTNKEIIEYFESGVIPPKRQNRPAMFFLNGDPVILNDPQREEFKSIFESKDKIENFTGSIAYKGVVKGKAKIITSVNDLPKVESGDILVSQFTRPEYLSAMQRAAAFITNDGGITCHAAIVARELQKPCIVGTKIATKVLKDGEMVEVDANKGIVKIIK